MVCFGQFGLSFTHFRQCMKWVIPCLGGVFLLQPLPMQPLSTTTHAGKSFHSARNYQHAKTRTTVPLVISELPRAVPAFPVCFTVSRDKYILTALMGLKPDQNLFVAQEGKWRTSYIPAYLRAHPFYLAEAREGKQVVCVDENSGLISEAGGEPMFSDGKPTQKMQQIIDFLEKIAKELAPGPLPHRSQFRDKGD